MLVRGLNARGHREHENPFQLFLLIELKLKAA